MNKYNIIWIYVDSVRRYYSSDDRSRIRIMDELANEGVELLNTVTSGPSTQMSISAMASSLPAYYKARTFSDYFRGTFKIDSIPQVLGRYGYYVYGILQSPRTREFNLNVFMPLERKYWPKGFKHSRYWDNKDINTAIDNTLNIGVNKPSFFFVNYNCRKDPLTNDRVKEGLNRFRESGFTEKNTITVLCSDHGYPDPSKNMGPEFYKRYNLTHDLVLSDDNIMIPLIIQYPDCPRGKKIETTVGSIDIYPTIMDILGIDIPHEIFGKSFLPLINDDKKVQKMMESRYFRCDSRLLYQTRRGTAIRNKNYKYIFYHDNLKSGNQDEFFNLEQDKYEQNNLVHSEDENIMKQLQVFRNEFRKSENEAMNYQLEFLFEKISNRHYDLIRKSNKILLVDNCNPLFIDLLIKMIRKTNDKVIIYLFKVEHTFDVKDENTHIVDFNVDNWAELDLKEITTFFKKLKLDLLFIPFNKSERSNINHINKFIKNVEAEEKVYLDYNIESHRSLSYIWKKYRPTLHFAKYEPLYLLSFFFNELIQYKKFLSRNKE